MLQVPSSMSLLQVAYLGPIREIGRGLGTRLEAEGRLFLWGGGVLNMLKMLPQTLAMAIWKVKKSETKIRSSQNGLAYNGKS